MTQVTSSTARRSSFQFDLSDAEFQRISKLAHQKYGLCLPDSKKALVYSRLSKRLRALGLSSFSDYCNLLSDDTSEEQTQLLTALTTNVTQFFREAHHFEALKKHVFPGLMTRARQGEAIRIWSAGCSSGQEPYSIAMCLLDFAPDAPKLDVRIKATDIDPQILRTARAGLYPTESFDAVPTQIRQADTRAVDGTNSEVSERIKGLVDFSELNLVSNWPTEPQCDVIFCRNVAIYFDAETKAALWDRFRRALRNDGHLFIGHSERLDRKTDTGFATIGVTAFRKTSPTGKGSSQ